LIASTLSLNMDMQPEDGVMGLLMCETRPGSSGGRTPTASRHETKKTKADVSIMTQTGVRRFS
jgi:hypothetical protein